MAEWQSVELSESRTRNLHTSPSERVNFSTPPRARRRAFSFSLTDFLSTCRPAYPVADDPQIIEAQLERGKKTMTGLNASTSSLSLLPSFNILSVLLPSRLQPSLFYNSVRYSRSLSGTRLHLLSTPSSRSFTGSWIMPRLRR